MSARLILTTIAVLLASCEGRVEEQPPDRAGEESGPGVIHIVTENYEGVLFTQNYSLGCYQDGYCPDVFDEMPKAVGVISFWEADATAVEAAEKILAREYAVAARAGSIMSAVPIWKSVDAPVRQYFGFSDSEGRKHVWISLLDPGIKAMRIQLDGAERVEWLHYPINDLHGDIPLSYSIEGDSLNWYSY